MEKHQNLILTGLMGVGKSTIGRLVALGLNRNFIDTDEYIEEKYGPVEHIFQRSDGDTAFQAIEEIVAVEMARKNNIIIATGGRFCLNPVNVQALSMTGKIICLTAPVDELVDRLLSAKTTTYRPRFMAAMDKIKLMEDLRDKSAPFLKQFEQISTSNTPPELIAEKLIARFH